MKNVVFIPNRSFTSYCGMAEIENDFKVPLFGSRNMLRMEDREEEQDYYWLLEEAGLPFPEKINGYEEIDCLSIVKLHHAEKKLERGFFTCASPGEFEEKSVLFMSVNKAKFRNPVLPNERVSFEVKFVNSVKDVYKFEVICFKDGIKVSEAEFSAMITYK